MRDKTRLLGRLARSIVLVSCGYGAACAGEDPVNTGPNPDAPQISSVSPDPMVEGQTAVLTGTNFSANTASNTVMLDNTTLIVTSASTTSLTVTIPEGCGPLRIASLRVTVGATVSDFFSATVAPDPAGDVIQNVALALGEQVVFRGPRHCLGLPTNGGSAQYLLGVQSTGRDGAVTRQVKVEGRASGAALAAVAPVPVAGTAPDVRPGFSPPLGDFTASPAYRAIRRHREGHDALMANLVRPVRNPALLFSALAPQRTPARAIVDGTENIGDQVDLRVRRPAEDCTAASTTTVTAELRVKTARSMWWVDVNNPPGGVSDIQLQGLATLFDGVIWDTEIAEFGPAGDLDGNGRIAILMTQEINADTTSGGQTLGFVNPCDLVSRGDSTGIFASNEGEFFYAIAADPTGSVGDTLSTESLLTLLPLILAHEFTHIIQFTRRFAANAPLMEPFVVEGQATLAEEIVGHAVLGNGPGQNLDAIVAFDFNDEQEFPWYFSPFADLVFYYGFPGAPEDPRVEGTPQQCTWIDADVEHPCGGRPLWYGVTWSFLRWASDLYGVELGGEAAFQTGLIDSDVFGFDNLEQALAGQGTLEDHLARWAAMLYMDDRPGASAENSMSSWDLRSIALNVVDNAWLNPVEYGFSDFTETVTVRHPSTAYFVVGGSAASSYTLRIGTPSGTDLASDVQVWLVRTQ